MSDNLDEVMLTGERRHMVQLHLLSTLTYRFSKLRTMIQQVTTYNDLLEAAEYAKGFSAEITAYHENWRASGDRIHRVAGNGDTSRPVA